MVAKGTASQRGPERMVAGGRVGRGEGEHGMTESTA